MDDESKVTAFLHFQDMEPDESKDETLFFSKQINTSWQSISPETVSPPWVLVFLSCFLWKRQIFCQKLIKQNIEKQNKNDSCGESSLWQKSLMMPVGLSK